MTEATSGAAPYDPRATIGTNTTDPRVGTTFGRDGWSVRVDTEYDADSKPTDHDAFTSGSNERERAEDAAILDYWRRDLWQYVVVMVSVSRLGVELGRASLGGVESGTFPVAYVVGDDVEIGERYVGPDVEQVDDLISEAIEDAERARAALVRDVEGKHWTVQFQPITHVVRVKRECEADETTTYVGPFASEDAASAYAERVEAASYGERDALGHVVVTFRVRRARERADHLISSGRARSPSMCRS